MIPSSNELAHCYSCAKCIYHVLQIAKSRLWNQDDVKEIGYLFQLVHLISVCTTIGG